MSRRAVTVWTLLVAAVACGAPGETRDGEGEGSQAQVATSAAPDSAGLVPCLPAEGALPAGATLRGAEGRYTLLMVRTTGPVDSVSGTLELSTPPAGFGRYRDMDVPLLGWAEVALDSIGAHLPGRLDSADPAAPGVLVLETGTGDAPPRILVRFGSEGNRRDAANFEGGYTVLDVREIRPAGFRGTWRSGALGPEVSGYFCAVRVRR